MTTTNNTNPTLTISYLNDPPDHVSIPTSFSEIIGDKEVAKENFQAIMKEFPNWVESRERWLDRYKSIRKSLEGNPNRIYILGVVLNKDHPNDWKYNVAQQNISIGCIFSFTLIQALGEGIFCTGPWLFVEGYAFGSQKKIFEIKIALERVK